jgi:predicted neuraminidase
VKGWLKETFAHTSSSYVPRCHASTIVEVANGDFLCAFFGGSGESSADEANFITRLERRADEWLPIRPFAKVPGHASGNIRLFNYQDTVCAVYAVNYGVWCRGGSRLFFTRSLDNGHTWSDPAWIQTETPMLGKNKGLVLENGNILLPCEREPTPDNATRPMGVLLSEDGGNSWQTYGEIEGADGARILQGTCIQRDNGSVLMLLRSDANRVYSAEGSADGKGWDRVARRTTLRNNHSGIDMVKLDSGQLILVFNDREGRSPSSATRTPLSMALSEDEGETWRMIATLENGPGEYSYPAVIQDSNGLIHVTYTWHRTCIKHVVFSTAVLEAE